MPHADPTARKAYMDAYNAARSEKRKPVQRAWYLKNRAKRIADQQAYHVANRDIICAKLRARRNADKEGFAARAKDWRIRNNAKTMLNSARDRARRLGLQCTITEADIIIPTHCPVLGIEIRRGEKRGSSPNSPTLDRIRSKGFYTPNNIRVISWRANRLKSDGTIKEFERILAYMRGEL